MSLNRNDVILIRQYLLGQLAEEEQQAIEQRLLTEDALFAELEVTEGELFDEYVANELTPADRKWFERYFLSTPERQRELKFAAGLREYVAKKNIDDDATQLPGKVAKGSWLERTPLAWIGQTQLYRIAAIAALLVVIGGALWFLLLDRHPPTSYATFTLTISNNDRAGSGSATEVNLPLTADAVRLYLKLPEALDQVTLFRVELLKESGETLNIERVALVEHAAVIELPATQLSRGQYALKLYVVKPDGTEERINGSYFLSVK
jgi:hypothetical protein